VDAALCEDAEGVLISLRVTPKSGKNAVTGSKNGLLLVAVRAAPADGEANNAVIATMAAALGCSKSSVTLVRGRKGREKTVRVTGLTMAQIQEKLSAY
jgi:uncharacterized protein (TIGR00251 family)